ncbi:MAG TPA: nitroreductase family protein, partial [Nocardioides sp.]|nr:nitroreductase family protein [Nocardioides sp.]
FALRVAAAHDGLGAVVEPFPDDDPDHLATVHLTGLPADDASLYDALGARHTHHGPYEPAAVDPRVLGELRAAAEAEGAQLHVMDALQRDAVAALVGESDHVLWCDRGWRRELARWFRTRHGGDGLPVSLASLVPTRFVVAHLDLGRRLGAADARLVAEAPAVVVLATSEDEPEDWLRSGQALQRVLLTATRAGLSAGFANQPCQASPALRARLGAVVHGQVPQMVARIGPSAPTRPTPRRPVAVSDGRGAPVPR